MSQVPKGKPIDADRATTEVPKRELTDAERAALDKQALRQKEQPPVPRFNMVADDRGFRSSKSSGQGRRLFTSQRGTTEP